MPFDLVNDDAPGVTEDDITQIIVEILPSMVKKSVDEGIRAGLYSATGYLDFSEEGLTFEQALKNWQQYRSRYLERLRRQV